MAPLTHATDRSPPEPNVPPLCRLTLGRFSRAAPPLLLRPSTLLPRPLSGSCSRPRQLLRPLLPLTRRLLPAPLPLPSPRLLRRQPMKNLNLRQILNPRILLLTDDEDHDSEAEAER
eukprot:4880126-Prymnesium_polylepis.1